MDSNIVIYCAEECQRQGSGPESIGWMTSAWSFAEKYYDQWGIDGLTVTFIEELGTIVDPVKNSHGIRTVRIFVTDGWERIEKTPPAAVERNLDVLCRSWRDLSYLDNGTHLDSYQSPTKKGGKIGPPKIEDLWYRDFENIHPFVDGNGRTGKILFNYIKMTLNRPELPYNWWNISNP